jgi:hypothetical protein
LTYSDYLAPSLAGEALVSYGYPIGINRIIVGTNFYETFNRDTVQLHSIKTANNEFDVDDLEHQPYDLGLAASAAVSKASSRSPACWCSTTARSVAYPVRVTPSSAAQTRGAVAQWMMCMGAASTRVSDAPMYARSDLASSRSRSSRTSDA